MTPSSLPQAMASRPHGADSSVSSGKFSRYSDSGAAAFVERHTGPAEADVEAMLQAIGVQSLAALTDQTIPDDIRLDRPLELDPPQSEHAALARLQAMVRENRLARSMIGMGYHDTHTPPVLRRNILENPLWYTPYTPYQAEIAQGRLEALLNFQTMVTDLTGLGVANASMLDEPTAAAEAMAMCHGIARGKKPAFFVAADAHPQTINVMRTRAWSMGIELRVGDPASVDFGGGDLSGVLVQYPTTDGRVEDYEALAAATHEAGALLVVATDLLALTLLREPGAWGGGGADIAVGNTQRFGVAMGYGGPHAAFMATHEKHVRRLPGRLVGVSKDVHGNPAFRLAIQTREQHIKRDKATSNICTAQVLLAVMAGMYAVWHGPEGLRRIAERVHGLTCVLAQRLRAGGHEVPTATFFDTISVKPAGGNVDAVIAAALERNINLRKIDERTVGISLDETTAVEEVEAVLAAFGAEETRQVASLHENQKPEIQNSKFARTSDYLTHEVFHRYRSETQMMRYLTRLHQRDVSLAHSMIPLGSCTMKLNAAAEMLPITWPEIAGLHPYAPVEQAAGYAEMFRTLEAWLAEITGFAAVSLQPNAGSQGEYAGLLAIRRYHEAQSGPGQTPRDVCLIPTSAHGTNPASAVIAGLRVVPVQCDERGNIDMADLEAKASEHADRLAAIMVTYPSTHGVFETTIQDVCRIMHEHGGQVYLDGANMNAQVGLTRPADYGADVVHLNLHKTFCIPHGGGGPGMGPIGVAAHLVDYLPGDPLTGEYAIAGASHGSPSILPISWMYIAMMGEPGLTRATQVAILNANYLAARLRDHYHVLYTGPNGRVAHEFILDCRSFEKSAGITVEDIAKRMIDFGFHAPTMSWPVPGTLMIEPTESESKQELDQFCDAMIAIREEIARVERGELDRLDNPLKHAPHTAAHVSSDDWPHAYGREEAAYPVSWLRDHKYWSPVGRIDNPYGDRNLVCTCPPLSEYGQG